MRVMIHKNALKSLTYDDSYEKKEHFFDLSDKKYLCIEKKIKKNKKEDREKEFI